MSGISDQYEQAIQLYNAGDIDGYVYFYADDAVMTLPRGTFPGRTAIREAWGRQAEAFPDQVLNVGATFEQGDTFADEFTWTATSTGPSSCETAPRCHPPASAPGRDTEAGVQPGRVCAPER